METSAFRKLSHRDHVLQRPGMYIGSTEEQVCPAWVLAPSVPAPSSAPVDEEGGEEGDGSSKGDGSVKGSVKGGVNGGGPVPRMELRDCRYVPALYKIFDEILVNAIDHTTRVKRLREADPAICPVKKICVTIDRGSGVIEVTNDGEGLPVDKGEHEVYVPELIFAHLLTSANFDDENDAERTIGGQNGIGAKACNIYSRRFEIETVDRVRKKSYSQVSVVPRGWPEARFAGAFPKSSDRCSRTTCRS